MTPRQPSVPKRIDGELGLPARLARRPATGPYAKAGAARVAAGTADSRDAGRRRPYAVGRITG